MRQKNVPFNLLGIGHVVFLVDDMDKALNFYQNTLGCPIGFCYPELGMKQVWAGAALIVLWDIGHPGAANAISPVSGGRNVDHVCLSLAPFEHDELKLHLSKHNINIEQEAFHGGARGMGLSFTFATRLETDLNLKAHLTILTDRSNSTAKYGNKRTRTCNIYSRSQTEFVCW